MISSNRMKISCLDQQEMWLSPLKKTVSPLFYRQTDRQTDTDTHTDTQTDLAKRFALYSYVVQESKRDLLQYWVFNKMLDILEKKNVGYLRKEKTH